MNDHSEIEELLALEALGGIELDDRARLASLRAEHGAGCAECLELEAAYRDVAAGLGADLAASALSEGLEERTVAAALDEPRADGAGAARAPKWRTVLVAVAAAFFLVVVGATAGYLAAPGGDERALDDFLAQPGVTLVPLEATDGQPGSVTLAVGPDGAQAYLLGSDLPALSAGQVYAFWTIAGETPASLGCAIPEDGRIRELVAGDFTNADLAAVTVENTACPSAPTTDPILVGSLD